MQRIYSLLYGVSACLLLIFAACQSLERQENPLDQLTEQATEPIHVRVLWTENPANHAIVSWTTLHKLGDAHLVYYDTISHKGDLPAYAHKVAPIRNGKISIVDEDIEKGMPQGFFHHSELNNLEPAKAYYFVVQSNGKQTEEFYFRTAPDDNRPFGIIWGSDSRAGGERTLPDIVTNALPDAIEDIVLPDYTPHQARQSMNEVIAQLVEDNDEIIAFAHGADYSLTSEWRHMYWWFEDHEEIITKDNRLLPLIISQGNHEVEAGFKENFYLDKSEEGRNLDTFYYNTDLSPEVSLITLNTEISVAGDQHEWLEAALATNRKEKKWVMVQYHRPAYPAVKSFMRQTFVRVRKSFVPLFEKYNVDLVAESDGHVLKRTLPIRNNKPDTSGIVYIGEGGLGVPQRPVYDSARWYVQAPGFVQSAHHVHVIRFSKDSLHVQAIGIDGEVLDDFVREPRAKSKHAFRTQSVSR
ncbi:metallophosphoesterase family protein [Pontibacter qinzhouensis]|uniref:Metallophosphoesterase family protein n=1 Tax=Pontibacter qinzhouensis TaxID=2603253 RepID=A0A5C8K9J2_9BACT|nr:metallophosphoesterase family protein [Pontibacter qinzhouensis]TXK46757.1 metallophosphoesterase family protein [Pontibacter qinzhouensis]